MDSDKGPVVFPLLTLGEVFHVKNSLCFFFVIISLADYFLGCISLTHNRLNQQGKNIRYCVYFPTNICYYLYLSCWRNIIEFKFYYISQRECTYGEILVVVSSR